MAIAITAYTDSDRVRSALGLDLSDVKETLLAASGLDISLTFDLDEWLPNHAALYAAGSAPAASTGDIKIMNAIKLYAQWYCAWELSGKKLAFVQIFTDGKAGMNRFDIDLDSLRAMSEAEKNKWKDLLAELAGQTVVASSYNPLGISTPTFDPITG